MSKTLNKNYVISHHLGLGDHIMMNGLVRHIYDLNKDAYDMFYLTCFYRNERNVRQMYSDLENFDLILLEDSPNSGLDDKINEYSKNGKAERFWLDHNEAELYYNGYGDNIFFDKYGYDPALIQRFKAGHYQRTNFYLKRYNFIHDTGYGINRDLITNGHRQVEPMANATVIDHITSMMNAEEIHVISSSFLCLCIAIPELAAKTTAHLYVRNPKLKRFVEQFGIKIIV